MRIERIDAECFGKLFPKDSAHIYNSAGFCTLNSHKCDDVHYLSIGDGKPHLGIVLGERDGRLLSPFSAPFGGFAEHGVQGIDAVEAAVDALELYGAELGKEIEITLPPAFYNENLYAKSVSALMRKGELMWTDLNYHYDLTDSTPAELRMARNARKNYRTAMRAGFETQLLDPAIETDVARAYAVIAANRKAKGYALRMSLQEVMETIAVAGTEFMVMTLDGNDVAAAQLNRVTDKVIQVVYWGDVPGYSHLRPMNRFTHDVFETCRQMEAKIVDVGPSSEQGVPSAGLCSFKESIGCTVSLKPHFRLGR